MGMLTGGTWSDDDDRKSDKRGAFQRVDSAFRNRVSADGASGFKAEPGRYQIYIAHNCPWAHRTAMFRKIKMWISDRPKVHGWGYSLLLTWPVRAPRAHFTFIKFIRRRILA